MPVEFTTELPDIDAVDADGSASGTVLVEWSDVLNNGICRIQLRADDPNGDHPDWGDAGAGGFEGTAEHGTLSYTFDGTHDGIQYSIRVRTETEYKTGAWVSTDVLTHLPAPEISFPTVDATGLTVGWAPNSTFNGTYRVHQMRTDWDADITDDRWLIGTADADETSLESDTVAPDREYEYLVRAETEWTSAESSTTITTDSVGLSSHPAPPSGWYAELEHPSGTTLRPQILDDARLAPTLKDQPQARIPVPKDDSYRSDSLEGASMHVWKDGQRRAIDEFKDVETQPARDVLVGVGATDLEKDIQVDVDEQATHALAADLVAEHSDLVLNVDGPETEISTGVGVAAASSEFDLENLLEQALDDETIPLTYEGGEIVPLQTAKLINLTGDDTDDAYIGGEAQGRYFARTADFDYTIPAEHVGLAIREGIMNDGVGDVDYRFNGVDLVTWDPGSPDEPSWHDYSSWYTYNNGPDLTGSAQFVAEQQNWDDAHLYTDAICIFDQRYHNFDDFDDEVHEPGGLLDSPHEYPEDPILLETETLAQFRRAVAGRVTITGDYGTGIDAIELTADNGQNWTTVSNADVLEAEFAEPGPYIRARVRLGSWDDGPRDALPRRGYNPQTLDSIEIEADFDNTPLVLNKSFNDDLVNILAGIADDANAVWEVRQEGDDTVFHWTWPGQRSSERIDGIADYSVTKHNRRIRRCTVRGASAPVNGETITVDTLGATYSLTEEDVVRGKESVRDGDGNRLRTGLDYELHGPAGEITILEGGRVDDGEEIEIDYEYTITGTYEHPDYDGNLREATTEQIPAASSERAAEQAAKVIVDENSEPRWEADVTLPASDIADIRLTDTLDLEGLPGEPQVVYEVQEDAGQVQLRLGNRSPVSETVQRIQSQLSDASKLV